LGERKIIYGISRTLEATRPKEKHYLDNIYELKWGGNYAKTKRKSRIENGN